MNDYYSIEKNVQILISLLKKNNIKKAILSPGTTNICFSASLQHDDFFELYSAPDERSAAYMAAGMAEESGEPVILSCTGATASRNYIPGLTEAYYRKIPVLAVTSTQHMGKIGHNVPQVIDRTSQLNDMVKFSAQVPVIHDRTDERVYTTLLNKAILELSHGGKGPVHINLTTSYTRDFSAKELMDARKIERHTIEDCDFPSVSPGRVGVLVGNHSKWTDELTSAVEEFCEKYNAAVIFDNTSNYKGRYGVLANIVTCQEEYDPVVKHFDLLIDIGNVSGAYMDIGMNDVWRVNPDGEIRDTYNYMTHIFEMSELAFFTKYNSMKEGKVETTFYSEWLDEKEKLDALIPELPFSNVWIAKQLEGRLPKNSVLHLGILNSLRAWNLFDLDNSIACYSNTGGFGIDGNLSSLIGASLASPEKLFFGIIGDLAFFYDMNSLGNRHVGNNIRIILINNGKGTEFRNYNHFAAQFGDAADEFIAAAGHYGNKSSELVKNYASSLGFKYLSASSKEELLKVADEFLDDSKSDSPIILEVFTNNVDESEANYVMNHLLKGPATPASQMVVRKAKNVVKKIIR